MSRRDNDFISGLRVEVDYSKIDFEKYKNSKNGKNSSEDPNKGERERDKTKERSKYSEGSREKKKLNEFAERLPGGFTHDMLSEGKRDELIKKVISLESKYLGITAPSYYNFFNSGPNSPLGFYCPTGGIEEFEDGTIMEVDGDAIYFNSAMATNTEEDYRELLDTIIHEMRHRYQDMIRTKSIQQGDVAEIITEYLEFSEDKYEDDFETFEGYWNNGLEADARAYARARVNLYITYSIDKLLTLEEPPGEVAKNQIIMEAGGKDPNGRLAPITVSNTFDSKEFAEIRNGLTDSTQLLTNESTNKGGKENMAMNQGTDFSEAAQDQAAKVYGSLIENIQSFSEKVVEHFVERVKTHPYKQLENVGNVFVKFYNEQLPKDIKAAISTWISSDNSFSASLREQYEGDESASVSAAQKTENKLLEQVDASFKNITPIKINSPISVDKEKIISDAEYVEGISKSLSNMKDQWMDRFSKYSEQNSLYATMMPMVATTFTNVESGYQATYKDIMNVSEEFKDARAVVVSRDISRGTELKKEFVNRLDIFKQYRKNIH